MQHTANSSYDYCKLLDGTDIRDWSAQCLIFDANSIKKAELREIFYKRTIEQLVSLVRQNPQLNFCDSEESKFNNFRNIARTLDAMIEGYIPLYTLATNKDNEYLPYDKLIANIVEKNLLDQNKSIDIWMEIPAQTGHRFRFKSATHSGAKRPPVPIQIGRAFRSKSAPPLKGEVTLDN